MKIYIKYITFFSSVFALLLFAPFSVNAEVNIDQNHDYFYRISLDLTSATENQDIILTWETSIPMTSDAEYGETSDMGILIQGDQSLSTTHRIEVNNLKSNHEYWYRPRGTDSANTQRAAPAIRFVTNPDYSPPQIFKTDITTHTNMATVIVTTNENAKCAVLFGINNLDQQVTESNMSTNHKVNLNNLQSSMSYKYQVVCWDLHGSESRSPVYFFTTSTTPFRLFSDSHPDQNNWYRNTDVIIRWEKPTDAIDFEYQVANKPNIINKPVTIDSDSTKSTFEEGNWYFNIRARNISGYGDIQSYNLKIDITPPEPLVLESSQSGALYGPAYISFKSKDILSQIKEYLFKIDNNKFQKSESPVIIDYWKVLSGNHIVKLKAVDFAGNERLSEINVFVPNPPDPIIDNELPFEFSYYQPFSLAGSGLAGSDLILIFSDKKQYKIRVDSSGRWIKEFNRELNPGRYNLFIQTMAGVNTSNGGPVIDVNIQGPWWIGREKYIVISLISFIILSTIIIIFRRNQKIRMILSQITFTKDNSNLNIDNKTSENKNDQPFTGGI